ncbi:unnamed protein product [Spirodela intermedia]|uniref:Uncharacterized protein n=1 Tax=Spirodela intermedia TaxID=51605 RepID=A0ABN7E9V1_SPIIN|nr:unnamed protein product [Spirodela intermedia]
MRSVGMPIGEEPRVGARTDRGTCASLPFHVTSGQPTVGQGVVIHTRERDLIPNINEMGHRIVFGGCHLVE